MLIRQRTCGASIYLSCLPVPGRWLGQDEATAEERRTTLEKFGFEWRLRVKDDEYDADGNPEEFSILCEGLSVRGNEKGRQREGERVLRLLEGQRGCFRSSPLCCCGRGQLVPS